jgi:hypothetical protein
VPPIDAFSLRSCVTTVAEAGDAGWVMISTRPILDSYFLRGAPARGSVRATAPIRLRGARGEFILPNEPDGIPPFGRSRTRCKSDPPGHALIHRRVEEEIPRATGPKR